MAFRNGWSAGNAADAPTAAVGLAVAGAGLDGLMVLEPGVIKRLGTTVPERMGGAVRERSCEAEVGVVVGR